MAEVRPMLYTVEQAVDILGGLSRATIFKMFKTGEIKPVRVGRRTFISRTQLEKFVERNTPLDG